MAADKRDVYPAVPELAPIPATIFPEYTIHPHSNFTLLGRPMGTNDYVGEAIKERLQHASSLELPGTLGVFGENIVGLRGPSGDLVVTDAPLQHLRCRPVGATGLQRTPLIASS